MRFLRNNDNQIRACIRSWNTSFKLDFHLMGQYPLETGNRIGVALKHLFYSVVWEVLIKAMRHLFRRTGNPRMQSALLTWWNIILLSLARLTRPARPAPGRARPPARCSAHLTLNQIPSKTSSCVLQYFLFVRWERDKGESTRVIVLSYLYIAFIKSKMLLLLLSAQCFADPHNFN